MFISTFFYTFIFHTLRAREGWNIFLYIKLKFILFSRNEGEMISLDSLVVLFIYRLINKYDCNAFKLVPITVFSPSFDFLVLSIFISLVSFISKWTKIDGIFFQIVFKYWSCFKEKEIKYDELNFVTEICIGYLL